MKILTSVYEKMLFCPPVPPETGGIIGEQNGVICNFCCDRGNRCVDSAIYAPDIPFLNSKIQLWQRQNVNFAGMFHSHPAEQEKLSSDDIQYIHTIFNSMPEMIKKLYFPIIIPGMKVLSFRAYRHKSRIVICDDVIDIVKEK